MWMATGADPHQKNIGYGACFLQIHYDKSYKRMLERAEMSVMGLDKGKHGGAGRRA